MVTKVEVGSLDNTSASDSMGEFSTYHLLIVSYKLVGDVITFRWFTTFNGEHVFCHQLIIIIIIIIITTLLNSIKLNWN